jgi:hypothetical protein
VNVIIEPHDGHGIVEEAEELRLPRPQPPVEHSLHGAGDVRDLHVRRGFRRHTLAVDAVERLDEVRGVEAALEVEGMLTDQVQGDRLTAGRRVSDEHAAVGDRLEEIDAPLPRLLA